MNFGFRFGFIGSGKKVFTLFAGSDNKLLSGTDNKLIEGKLMASNITDDENVVTYEVVKSTTKTTAQLMAGAEKAYDRSAELDKIAGMQSTGVEIDGSVKKTYTKLVKEVQSDPQDGNLINNINGFAQAYDYGGEVFNAVKVYVRVKKTTTLRVMIFSPNEIPKPWYTRGEYASGTITVTPNDRYIVVPLNSEINASVITEANYYIGVRTEDASGVELALNNVVVSTSRVSGLDELYISISTQPQSPSNGQYRWNVLGDAQENDEYVFWFELLLLDHNGIRAEFNEQSYLKIEDKIEKGELNIVQYPYNIVCEEVESNIYYDNLKADSKKYDVAYRSALNEIGRQQEERWTLGDKSQSLTSIDSPSSITFYDTSSKKEIGTYRFEQRIVQSSVGSGTTPIALIIGDSTTAAGIYTQRLVDIASTDAMNIALIGTVGSGSNLHEGYAGMTAEWFCTNESSPFVFSGVLDFGQYISSNVFATPDIISINLGINDIVSKETSARVMEGIDNNITYIDTLVANIRTYTTTSKIVINTLILPSNSQDAFGASYGVNQYRAIYKEAVCEMNKRIISEYRDRENEEIYLNCGLSLHLDTDIGFDYIDEQVTEHSIATKARKSNGVHPNSAGYKMIGDALWSFFKYLYR